MAAPPTPPPDTDGDMPGRVQVFGWALQLWIIVALLVVTVALVKFLSGAWFR